MTCTLHHVYARETRWFGDNQPKGDLTRAEEAFQQGLQTALDAGYTILNWNGSACNAVEQAVRSLEENELFNAGKGSVFTANKKHEIDASTICGRSKSIGQ